jgi:hypothetical protein
MGHLVGWWCHAICGIFCVLYRYQYRYIQYLQERGFRGEVCPMARTSAEIYRYSTGTVSRLPIISNG